MDVSLVFIVIFYGVRHPVFIISMILFVLLNKKVLSKMITKFKLIFNLFYMFFAIAVSLSLVYGSMFASEYIVDSIDYGVAAENQSNYKYFKKHVADIDKVVSDVEIEFTKSMLSFMSDTLKDESSLTYLNNKYSSDKLTFSINKSYYGPDIKKKLVCIVYDGNKSKKLKVPIIIDNNKPIPNDVLSVTRGASEHSTLNIRNFSLNLLEAPISIKEDDMEIAKIQTSPYEIIAIYDSKVSDVEPIKYIIKNNNYVAVEKVDSKDGMVDLLKEGYKKRYNADDVYDIEINEIVKDGSNYSGSIMVFWKDNRKTPFNFYIKDYNETDTTLTGDVRILLGIYDKEDLKSDVLTLDNECIGF